MISVDEAINIIMDHTLVLGTERVPTQNVLNRVLAEDIITSRHQDRPYKLVPRLIPSS